MKKKALLSILLVLALLVTQFSMLGVITASATSYSALTGRSDFKFGVNIRGNNIGSSEYHNTYAALKDAKNLGSNIIRIKNDNGSGDGAKFYPYFAGLGEIAEMNGMEIMLQETGIHQWVFKSSGDDKIPCTKAEVEANISAIESYYTTLATALKGKIAYYQIGNEMDILSKDTSNYLSATNANAGRTTAQFVDLQGVAVGIYHAMAAIQAVDPNAQFVINTSWKDSGFISKLKSYYIDTDTGTIATGSSTHKVQMGWDVTGLDFYAQSGAALASDYTGVLSDLVALSESVMIVEAGLTTEINNGTVSYNGNAAWLADFVTYAYNQSNVKGFISFELYDNVSYYGVNEPPAYHGLISSDGTKKAEYTALQTLFGGSDSARPVIGAVDSTDEMAGDIVEMLDASVHELSMGNTFSASGSVSNIFFDDVVASTKVFGNDTILEFDMYVEDAAAFRAAVESSGRNLLVYLSGDGNKARYAMNLAVNNIEKDGWNHIVVGRQQFSDTGNKTDLTGSPITGIHIGYKSGNYPSNPASGLKIAFANFCLTSIGANQKTPNIGTYYGTETNAFPENYKAQKFGDSYSDLVTRTNYKTATNIPATNFIQFDVYIDNYTNFMNSLTKDADDNDVNYGLGFCLSQANGNANTSTRYSYDITQFITHSGWNRIILWHTGNQQTQIASSSSNTKNSPIAPYFASGSQSRGSKHSYCLAYIDYSTKDSVVLGNTGYDYPYASGSVKNPAKNDFIGMTYVTFSSALAAPEIDLTGKVIWTKGDSNAESAQKVYKQFTMNKSATGLCKATRDNSVLQSGTQLKNFKLNLDGDYCDNIEFDLYVDSDAYLKKIVDSEDVTDHGIYFQLADEQSRIAQYDIKNQITTAGWNHIVTPVVDQATWEYLGNGFTKSKALSKAYIAPGAGIDAPATNYDQNFNLAIANLITTKAFTVPVAPEKIESVYDSIGADETYTVDASSGEYYNELSTAFDMDTNTIIEFDVYTETVDLQDESITFFAEDGNGDSVEYNITPYLTNVGWNHVLIRLSNLTDGATFDASNIVAWGIGDTNTAFTGYIANLYAAENDLGDVNRDGSVNIVDLIRSKKIIANQVAIDWTADLDSDYRVAASDLTALVEILLN